MQPIGALTQWFRGPERASGGDGFRTEDAESSPAGQIRRPTFRQAASLARAVTAVSWSVTDDAEAVHVLLPYAMQNQFR